MGNLPAPLSPSGVLSCTELGDKRILVTGNNLIKLYSQETKQEIKDIASENENWDSLVIRDKKMVFISTNKGLHQYSLPEFTLVKVHVPTSYGLGLAYLKSKSTVIFKDRSDLLTLNLATSTVAKIKKEHIGYIFRFVLTKDEKFLLTSGGDRTFKQWSTDSWSLVKSVTLSSSGISMMFRDETGTILISMADGSLAEYSLKDLSLVRTVKVHSNWIRKIK